MVDPRSPGINPCRCKVFGGRFYRFRIAGSVLNIICHGKHGGRERFCLTAGRIPTALPKLLAAAFRYAKTVAYTERREESSSQTEMSG